MEKLRDSFLLNQKVFDTNLICEYNDNEDKSLRNHLDDGRIFGKGMTEMKSTGIIRKVDDLGRVVLPIELRRVLDIAERDELEIFVENERIILQKHETACVFCGSTQDLVEHSSKNVCRTCIQKLTKK